MARRAGGHYAGAAIEPPIVGRLIWNGPLDFVVAPEHPLACAANVSLAETGAYLQSFPGPIPFHQCRESIVPGARVYPADKMSTNYLETIKMMVSDRSWPGALLQGHDGQQVTVIEVCRGSLAAATRGYLA